MVGLSCCLDPCSLVEQIPFLVCLSGHNTLQNQHRGAKSQQHVSAICKLVTEDLSEFVQNTFGSSYM